MSDTNDNELAAFVWPIVNYADARAGIAFLVEAFGFEETLVVSGETEDVVEHAQLRWPPGGGVMVGSANRPGNPFSERPTGAGSYYAVTDEPDALHARAIAAGAKPFRDLQDEDYGSRGFTVSDPEGNIWSFGTYRGEPR